MNFLLNYIIFAVAPDADTWQEQIAKFHHKYLANDTLPGALFYALIAGIAAWLVGRALALGFERLLDHPRYIHPDRTAIKFLARLTRLIVYLVAFGLYAHQIPALQNLGKAWLASVGVVSVVFGLAAQNTLGNLIAGISLLLYRPFNLGDRLLVNSPSGQETGTVESLTLGYTVLRTADNRRIVVPNSTMASQTCINLSLTDARKQCIVPIRISHESDVAKARAILIELAKQQPKTLEVIGCPVTGLGATSVTLSLQLWCADSDTATNLKNTLMEQAKEKFAQAGIQLFRGSATRLDSDLKKMI